MNYIGINGIMCLKELREEILGRDSQGDFYMTIMMNPNKWLDYKYNYSNCENGKRTFSQYDKIKISEKQWLDRIQAVIQDYHPDIMKDSIIQTLDRIQHGLEGLLDNSPPSIDVINNTLNRIIRIREDILSFSDINEVRYHYYIALQVVFSFFIHAGLDNPSQGCDHAYPNVIFSNELSYRKIAYRILPVLNRLSKCTIHNARVGRNTPVYITRPCLYALLICNLSAENVEQLRNILLKETLDSGDSDRLKEYFRLQGQNESNIDHLQWREICQNVFLKPDISRKHWNISLLKNTASIATESETIDCLYRSLNELSHSSLSNHQYLIDQTCLTLARLLNSLSSHGYYQQAKNDKEVIELRRKQLLSSIYLLLEKKSSSTDYIFALIEKDSDGNDLVDGLDKQIVHEIVIKYYDILDTTKGLSTIGKQYLEWCTRNSTIFPRKLITELVCFDLPLWEYYANRDFFSMASSLYVNIFCKFKNVPTDINVINPISSIEKDQVLIRTIRKMFFLFSNVNSRDSYRLRGFFLVASIDIPDYYECIAKMTLYILYNPSSFRDNGNEHNFNKFIQYMLLKTTNRSWLYQCVSFKRFNQWDSVITNDRLILNQIKSQHEKMYRNKLQPYSLPAGFGSAVPSNRSLEERIESFNHLKTSINRRKEVLIKLLNQILREWCLFTPIDQEKGVNFAREWIQSDDPDIFCLAFSIINKAQDTSEFRLQKLRSVAENGHTREILSIKTLEGLITPNIEEQLLENPNCLTSDHWQGKLLDMLLGKKNTTHYLHNPESFPNIRQFKNRLCEIFASLPEDLQINLIYSVREEPDLLKKIDFSLLSFEDQMNNKELKPINISFHLWRFYHEFEEGKLIQLGSLSMEEITLDIIYECFCALLISNREVRSLVGQEWNNVVFHIAKDTKMQPAQSANICAFAAFKLLGWLQNRVGSNEQSIKAFDTQISELSCCVFSHPCLYNLMTNIMNNVSSLMFRSGQTNSFQQIITYIRDNAAADQRKWFDTDIVSSKNDKLEDILIDANNIWVSRPENCEIDINDQEFNEYIQRGDFNVPFCSLEPIVVVEESGTIFGIEKRRTVRYAQKYSEQFRKKIRLKVQKLVYSNTFNH